MSVDHIPSASRERTLRAPRERIRRMAGGLALAAALGMLLAPGTALGAHLGQSVAGVPPQRDVVISQGQVVVFLTCLGSSPCSGVLRLHLAGGRVGAGPSEGPRGIRGHRRLTAWTPGGRLPIARRKVMLRQRRVTPVSLRLPASAVALIGRSGGSLTVRAVVRQGPRTVAGTIVLQLAGVGVGAA